MSCSPAQTDMRPSSRIPNLDTSSTRHHGSGRDAGLTSPHRGRARASETEATPRMRDEHQKGLDMNEILARRQMPTSVVSQPQLDVGRLMRSLLKVAPIVQEVKKWQRAEGLSQFVTHEPEQSDARRAMAANPRWAETVQNDARRVLTQIPTSSQIQNWGLELRSSVEPSTSKTGALLLGIPHGHVSRARNQVCGHWRERHALRAPRSRERTARCPPTSSLPAPSTKRCDP